MVSWSRYVLRRACIDDVVHCVAVVEHALIILSYVCSLTPYLMPPPLTHFFAQTTERRSYGEVLLWRMIQDNTPAPSDLCAAAQMALIEVLDSVQSLRYVVL